MVSRASGPREKGGYSTPRPTIERLKSSSKRSFAVLLCTADGDITNGNCVGEWVAKTVGKVDALDNQQIAIETSWLGYVISALPWDVLASRAGGNLILVLLADDE